MHEQSSPSANELGQSFGRRDLLLILGVSLFAAYAQTRQYYEALPPVVTNNVLSEANNLLYAQLEKYKTSLPATLPFVPSVLLSKAKRITRGTFIVGSIATTGVAIGAATAWATNHNEIFRERGGTEEADGVIKAKEYLQKILGVKLLPLMTEPMIQVPQTNTYEVRDSRQGIFRDIKHNSIIMLAPGAYPGNPINETGWFREYYKTFMAARGLSFEQSEHAVAQLTEELSMYENISSDALRFREQILTMARYGVLTLSWPLLCGKENYNPVSMSTAATALMEMTDNVDIYGVGYSAGASSWRSVLKNYQEGRLDELSSLKRLKGCLLVGDPHFDSLNSVVYQLRTVLGYQTVGKNEATVIFNLLRNIPGLAKAIPDADHDEIIEFIQTAFQVQTSPYYSDGLDGRALRKKGVDVAVLRARQDPLARNSAIPYAPLLEVPIRDQGSDFDVELLAEPQLFVPHEVEMNFPRAEELHDMNGNRVRGHTFLPLPAVLRKIYPPRL